MSARHYFPRSGLALALVCAWWSAAGQPPCDSLHTVNFTWQGEAEYTTVFSAGVPPSGTAVYSADWGFAGEDFQATDWGMQVAYAFPGPGDYLVCLLSTVQDLQQGACLSADCQLIHLPVDSLCAGLVPGFNIALAGDSLNFINQTVSGSSLNSVLWDFGDGTSSTEGSPMHAYAGYGPYEACLTVASASCTATACNWIYLGPADVPCENVLQANIHIVQLGRGIAGFDHSITSGMEHSIVWDLGDGTSNEGNPILHLYGEDGVYEICATVNSWGPLATDTCTATTCTTVSTYIAAGISGPASPTGLVAHPMPFGTELMVDHVPAGATWEVLDLVGRRRLAGVQPHQGTLLIQGGELAAGTYLLLVQSSKGSDVVRIVKT